MLIQKICWSIYHNCSFFFRKLLGVFNMIFFLRVQPKVFASYISLKNFNAGLIREFRRFNGVV